MLDPAFSPDLILSQSRICFFRLIRSCLVLKISFLPSYFLPSFLPESGSRRYFSSDFFTKEVLFCLRYELLWMQPCCFAPYQWRTEKGRSWRIRYLCHTFRPSSWRQYWATKCQHPRPCFRDFLTSILNNGTRNRVGEKTAMCLFLVPILLKGSWCFLIIFILAYLWRITS